MRYADVSLVARIGRWPVASALAAAMAARPAHAGTDAPWAPAIDTIMGWLQGPTAIAVITIAILFAGYALLFKGEQGRGFRTAGFIAIGIALIAGAAAIAAEMYTGAGATLR
ncbi:MAG: TrbC/VirB2 family protein [Geminicoccaceae bacterium]